MSQLTVDGGAGTSDHVLSVNNADELMFDGKAIGISGVDERHEDYTYYPILNGGDKRVMVFPNSENPKKTITLTFASTDQNGNPGNNQKVDVYALVNCTLVVYDAQNNKTTYAVLAGNMLSVYYLPNHGWKMFGVYGAVWN